MIHRKRKIRKDTGITVLRKNIYSIIVVVLLQALVCIGMLSLGGAIKRVRTEKYTNFSRIVLSRSEKLQDILIDKRETVKYYKEKLQNQIAAELAVQNRSTVELHTDLELNEAVVAPNAGYMKELLKESRASGAFIVLDGYGEDSELKYGYYIRNSKIDSTDERNFTVLRGTEELLEQAGLPMDKNWRSEFRINHKSESDFYNKIYHLLQTQTKYNSLAVGYWSPAFTMYGDDEKVITYTLPLVDQEGEFYGILGIDLNEQMLLEELPHLELSDHSNGSYYLAYRESEHGAYSTMFCSAGSGKDLTDQNGELHYGEHQDRENIYVMNEGLTGDYVGTIAQLELYTSQSPFSGEQWSLVGAENEEDLLETYWQMMFTIVLAISFIIILGIFEVWYISIRFIPYIRSLTYSIQQAAPEEALELARTDIREIDLLADAIRQLHERAISSEKLAEIIDMAGIPVGAIEFRKEEKLVFCTQSAAEILEFHHVDKEKQYISRKAFDVEVEVLNKNLTIYEEEEDTYQMTSKSGVNKWIRITYKEQDNRILIAVLDVTAEILEKQKIEYERDYDILTRLLNRNAFRARMGQLLKRGNLGIAAVVMMDLDNLKFFNDTYGHEYGDKYIREAAVVLSTLNQHNALVARMSGDEFLMFISGYSDKDEIRRLVSDVHNRLLESYITVPGGENIKLRASAGIAWYPEDATYLDELIKYADFAMYETKSRKKGNIKEFNREAYQKDAVLFTGKEELNRLLEEEGMVRYIFQPIVEVATGEIFGYEALMRPQIESLRSPEDVMRLAKAQSKLYQVERVTWKAALAALEEQRKLGDKFRIFINSVPNHVLDEEDTKEIERLYQHIFDRIIIEIIESEQTDKSCMETKCEWAKKHGASIALDDFGTGYSNESTLLYINPDYVKLDMSIISNIHKDESRQKIVQGLLNYTKSHGIKIIAEGIDSYEEMKTLINLGVDYMQGWYLARGQFEIEDIPSEIKMQIRACVQETENNKNGEQTI